MIKKVIISICTLCFTFLLYGCASSNLSTEDTSVVSGRHDLPAPFVNSFDDLHKHILAERELNNMQYYYVPSWIPEKLTLQIIMIHDRYIEYWFRGYKHELHASDSNKEAIMHALDFMFRWWYPLYESDRLTSISDVYMRPETFYMFVDGIDNVRYYDQGTHAYDPFTIRTFSWIQDGYFFNLSLPLWMISNNAFGEEFYVSHETFETIVSSARRIELE